MTDKKKEKPNCRECKYMGIIHGDAHSKCTHPSIGKIDPMSELLGIFASVGRVSPVTHEASKKLNIKGNPHGIKNGWFNWPMNFDPLWLENCDGFTPKQTEGE